MLQLQHQDGSLLWPHLEELQLGQFKFGVCFRVLGLRFEGLGCRV